MATALHDALSIYQLHLENEDDLIAKCWLLNVKKLISKGHQETSWNDIAVKVYAALGETTRAWLTA